MKLSITLVLTMVQGQLSDIVGNINYSIYSISDSLKPLHNFNYNKILNLPDDTFRTFEEICIDKGYRVERHAVLTEDGYINTMFRVYKDHSYSILGESKVPKPVVFMQHGFADSSDTFIINTKENSPAFIFADEGYDIWLGNTRGNKYSRKHTTYNPDKDEAYWNHSFPDLYNFDIKAFLEYIKEKS